MSSRLVPSSTFRSPARSLTRCERTIATTWTLNWFWFIKDCGSMTCWTSLFDASMQQLRIQMCPRRSLLAGRGSCCRLYFTSMEYVVNLHPLCCCPSDSQWSNVVCSISPECIKQYNTTALHQILPSWGPEPSAVLCSVITNPHSYNVNLLKGSCIIPQWTNKLGVTQIEFLTAAQWDEPSVRSSFDF